ncbi:acyl transferase/acyl hydrolase/lysophospholipase, partial [Microdochium trichocladiopsis]
CGHSRWLSFVRHNGRSALEATDCPQRLLHNLPDPDSQRPVVITTIGNRLKVEFLRSLGVNVDPRRKGESRSVINLSMWPKTIKDDSPAIFMDTDIPRDGWNSTRSLKPAGCHESVFHNCDHLARERPEAIADVLARKALFPFSDVLCVFAPDIGGVVSVGKQIASWMRDSPSTPFMPRPWLIVVVERALEGEALDTIIGTIRTSVGENVSAHFACIRVVRVDSKPAQRHRQWPSLAQEFSCLFPILGEERQRYGCLFTARHLAGFLHDTAGALTLNLAERPNLISVSRAKFPPAEDHHEHLSRFIASSAVSTCEEAKEFLLPTIASSLILDHYVPQMHNFEPDDVFETLYLEKWKSALQRANLSVIPPGGDNPDLICALRAAFRDAFREYLVLGSSEELHLNKLSAHKSRWEVVHSNETCLCCLRRQPKYWFSCGHSLCECCVEVFSKRDVFDPLLCELEGCLLCGRVLPATRIKLWPRTAGVRVLSIDGGGIRGRIPLEFLRVLQDHVALPLPIQSHFDLVFGTSSGAIIACALCINGWDIKVCTATFESFAAEAFKARFPYRVPLLTKIYDLCLLMIADCRYSATNLEQSLQAVFGPTRSMLEYSRASEMGILVGVPVTTTSDVSCHIFSNYNGSGHWSLLMEYSYFPARHVDGLERYQDGGLLYNNPASVAIREVAAMFPTARKPSTLVSLGTGSSHTPGDHAIQPKRFWNDWFVLRGFRALMQSGSSERAWQQLESHWNICRSGKMFRFDVDFQQTEPPLDDVDSMKEIAVMANQTILRAPHLKEAACSIRAELFLFELDECTPFLVEGGLYKCQGKIICRLDPRVRASHELLRQLYRSNAKLSVNGVEFELSFLTKSDLTDGRTFMRVEFTLSSRLDKVQMVLQEQSHDSHISGSPFTLQRLLDQQNLEHWFGNHNHRKR